jgi:hypothetical protein
MLKLSTESRLRKTCPGGFSRRRDSADSGLLQECRNQGSSEWPLCTFQRYGQFWSGYASQSRRAGTRRNVPERSLAQN